MTSRTFAGLVLLAWLQTGVRAVGAASPGISGNQTGEANADSTCLADVVQDIEEGSLEGQLIFVLISAFVCTASDLLILKLPERLQLPISVVLFLEGVLLGTIFLRLLEAQHYDHHTLGVGTILNAFRHAAFMDPHALFFIILPPLLFESSSNMSWHILRKVLPSAYLLAWPGVVMNTLATGCFVKAICRLNGSPPSWEVALLLASVLSATDPVAVVSALGDIGAPEKLSTLVDGESLVNDGSAVVVMQVFRDWVVGSKAPPSEQYCPTSPPSAGCILQFFTQVAGGGTLIGVVGAYLLSFWISMAHSLHRPVLETTVILAMIYSTFFVAEGVGTSGVLATVSLGIISSYSLNAGLSHEGRHSHHAVLGQIAYISNQLAFFTSGFITVRFMGQPQTCSHNFMSLPAWGELALLYLALHVSRGVMIALFSPALQRLGYGLTWKEGIMLVFSGLRGAVALIMGMLILGNEYIEDDAKQMMAFHISGIVVLTLFVNGTFVGKVYRALGVYPKSKYSTSYIHKIFAKFEADCRKGGVYKMAQNWFFADVKFDMLVRCMPNFCSIFVDDNGRAVPHAIAGVGDVLAELSDAAISIGKKTTIGLQQSSQPMFTTYFDEHWASHHTACDLTFKDLLENRPAVLEQIDFREDVSFNSRLDMVHGGSGSGFYLSAQSIVDTSRYSLSPDTDFSVSVLRQVGRDILIGVHADFNWPQHKPQLPEVLGGNQNSVSLNCRDGTVKCGNSQHQMGPIPDGAVVMVNAIAKGPLITSVEFSWRKSDSPCVEASATVQFGPFPMTNLFPAAQFLLAAATDVAHDVGTEIGNRVGEDSLVSPTSLPAPEETKSRKMKRTASKGRITADDKHNLPMLSLSYPPRLLADSESINGFFRKMFNVLRSRYTHMFERGLLGSQSYSWLLEAVNEATDSANHERHALGYAHFAKIRGAVHGKASQGCCSGGPSGPEDAEDMVLMDIVEPLLIEFLSLEKRLGKSSLLERMAERLPVLKMFAYMTAAAKVETLWAFIESHEELLQQAVFSVERFPPVVECINRLVATAKSDLSLLDDAMPHRVFLSKHGLALRMMLNRRLHFLENAVDSGMVGPDEADSFAKALRSRIVQASHFWPRRPWLPFRCRIRRKLVRLHTEANAWAGFEYERRTLEPDLCEI